MIKQMKKQLFNKALAIVLSSSVIIFGASSVTASSSQLSTTRKNELGNVKNVIAQTDSVDVGVAIAIAIDVLGQAVSVVETRAISNEIPEDLVPVVNQALGDAQRNFATAQSSAEQGEYFAAATALSTGISVLGDGVVASLAAADAGTAQALTEVILSAEGARAGALGQASTDL